MSVDGFIADRAGGFESFPNDEVVTRDFFASLDDFDTVIMGRKTYEVGLLHGVTNPYPNLRTIVFSKTMEASPDPAVTLDRGDPVERVRALVAIPGKPVWLCGGADIAGQLLGAS